MKQNTFRSQVTVYYYYPRRACAATVTVVNIIIIANVPPDMNNLIAAGRVCASRGVRKYHQIPYTC